jgi:hypothetical protein
MNGGQQPKLLRKCREKAFKSHFNEVTSYQHNGVAETAELPGPFLVNRFRSLQ